MLPWVILHLILPRPALTQPYISSHYWEVGSVKHIPDTCSSGILKDFSFPEEPFSTLSTFLHFCENILYIVLAILKNKTTIFFLQGDLNGIYLQDRINSSDYSLNIMFKVILPLKKRQKDTTTQHKCCNFSETSSCKINSQPLYLCYILLSCRSVEGDKEVIILHPSHSLGDNFFPLSPSYTCQHT